MDKREASDFLKELLAECELDQNSFVLMEPNPKDLLSTGYKIRIETLLSKELRRQLIEITKRHDLAVIEEQIQIIVYKPKSDKIRSKFP